MLSAGSSKIVFRVVLFFVCALFRAVSNLAGYLLSHSRGFVLAPVFVFCCSLEKHPRAVLTVLTLAQLFFSARIPCRRCASLRLRKALRGLRLVRDLGTQNALEVLTMNNQLTIIGRVGQNPRAVNFADTGNKVVKFSLGVTEYSNKKEEEKTLWIDVDCWNGLGERVMQTITKGREVLLTGRLAINTFTKEVDGKTVEVHKPILKLTSFHLCGPKPKAEQASSDEESTAKGNRKSA